MTNLDKDRAPDLHLASDGSTAEAVGSGRRSLWRQAGGIVSAGLLLGGIGVYVGGSSRSSGAEVALTRTHKTAKKPELPKSTTPTTIAPANKVAPNFAGQTCSYESRTVVSGDTFFGLTTVGLHGDQTFMNAIYAWNLKYLQTQSSTDPELANPNNLAVGEKLKILANCVNYQPIGGKYFNYGTKKQTETYKMSLEYQDYPGTDGKKHELVTVFYDSTKEGALLRVDGCNPAPRCEEYVAGIPAHPDNSPY